MSRRLPLVALAALLAATAVACSGGSAARPTDTPAPPVASPTNAPPTATPTPDLGPPAADGQRALALDRKLAVEIGPRVAGSPAEATARDLLKSMLETYGYDVTVAPFAFDASSFLFARVDAAGAAIPAYSMQGAASGAVAARIIPAGTGRPEDFPPAGLGGAIALVERSDLPFAVKVRNAIAAGAGAVVIYNNADGALLGELGDTVTIPVVGIKQAAGRDLAASAAAGVVQATVTVPQPKATGYNILARPKGVAQCATITGGHYDSVAVTGGADDNASGTASVVEAARLAAVTHLAGANCFALFSGEEFGLFGSKEFVANLAPADVAALRAMINLDVVGRAEDLVLIGSTDLVETARLAAQRLGITATTGALPPGAASDHVSFQEAGVPVVMFYRADEDIHTPADAIDRIDAASLRDTASVALATLRALNGG